ncbi:hypothetical protein D3C83_127070 [compost metagenome]
MRNVGYKAVRRSRGGRGGGESEPIESPTDGNDLDDVTGPEDVDFPDQELSSSTNGS